METNVSNKRKLCRTFNLFLGFFGLGLCIAIPGPTLLDLQQIVNTTTDYISWIYPARSIGYLTGSIIGGVLLDRYNRQLLLLLVLLMAAVTSVIPPWCRDMITLGIDFIASGIALGMLDTCANVWCLDMWKRESGPFIQALHFSFGVGAVIAPLIAEPFLSKTTISLRSDNTSTVSSPDEFATVNFTNNVSSTETELPGITYAYGLVGMYILLIAFIVFVEAITNPAGTKRSPNSGPSREDTDRRLNVLILIALSGLFFCAYSGLEVAFGQYLTSFVVKSELKSTKSTGSFLTSIYWGSYTLFRGVAIGCAKLMKTETMLIIDVTLLVVANGLLTAFGGNSIPILCTGSILLGAGVSSLFPSTFAYLEEYIDVSNKIASIFMVTASFGEMALPILIGYYIDNSPMVLMYVNLACGCVCFLVFMAMRQAARRCGSKYCQADGEDDQSGKDRQGKVENGVVAVDTTTSVNSTEGESEAMLVKT